MNKTILRKQHVRILATDELGTVAEKVFIKRRGGQRPELYCRVWLDKKPKEDRWYWGSELGDIVEKARATFAFGVQEIHIDATLNHETNRWRIEMTGTPEHLQKHRGLHMALCTAMLQALGAIPEDLEQVE